MSIFISMRNKSSSGDETPERDVTYLRAVYLLLNYDTPVLPEYVLTKAYHSHIILMDVVLRKTLSVFLA